MNDPNRQPSPEISDRNTDATEMNHNIHQVMMEQQSRIIHEVNTVIDDESRSNDEKE
jgi:hypothetical protein